MDGRKNCIQLHFYYRLTIVDTDDKVYLTGELRHVMEAYSTRATVQISNEFAGSYGCPENVECTGCPEVQDAALIVGRDDETSRHLFIMFSWL